MSAKRIRINDIRQAGHCTAGARAWFQANSLNFRTFLDRGLPEQTLIDTGDVLAEQVIESRRERRLARIREWLEARRG